MISMPIPSLFLREIPGGKAKEIDEADVEKLKEILKEKHFGKLVAHAPYTLNPCSATEKTRNFAHMAMEDDMRRMEYLPGNYYNFHPGSHVGQGIERGIELISDLLNQIITPEQSTVILLETMSGKGSEVGSRFEELAEIISRVNHDEKMGVCLDTCHVSDAGYDIINDLDGVLEEFDRVVGLDRLKALHINDSMNERGAHKRSARLYRRRSSGAQNHTACDQPSETGRNPLGILETPQEDLEGYTREIKMLRKESETYGN